MSSSKVGFFSSIRGRLILANLASVLVLLGLSVVSSQQFRTLGQTIGVISNGAELLLHLGHVADQREAAVGALELGYGNGDDAGARAKLDALLADSMEHLRAAETLSSPGPELTEAKKALAHAEVVSRKLATFAQLSEDARTEASTEADDQLSDAFSSVQKAKRLASHSMETRLGEVSQALRRPIVLLWTATLLGCLVALAVALFTNRRVARPIGALMAGVENLARGNLDEIGVHSSDELGQLGSAFNAMAGTITERNKSLRLVLDNVGDALMTVARDGRLLGSPSLRATVCCKAINCCAPMVAGRIATATAISSACAAESSRARVWPPTAGRMPTAQKVHYARAPQI